MRRRPSVQAAFDEARFGPTRILNVRDGLLGGAEAVHRVNGWLRSKQVERAGEVLIVTGRGKSSLGGVPVVRPEVLKLLTSLKRRGVVSEVREHTAGSFVVLVAPLRALFEAPARHRELKRPLPPLPVPRSLEALSAETRDVLRALAFRALQSLGVAEPTDAMTVSEMDRQFALLSRAITDGASADAALAAAAHRALDEYDDAER